MYKSYVVYLQHILDECLYVRSVITDTYHLGFVPIRDNSCSKYIRAFCDFRVTLICVQKKASVKHEPRESLKRLIIIKIRRKIKYKYDEH